MLFRSATNKRSLSLGMLSSGRVVGKPEVGQKRRCRKFRQRVAGRSRPGGLLRRWRNIAITLTIPGLSVSPGFNSYPDLRSPVANLKICRTAISALRNGSAQHPRWGYALIVIVSFRFRWPQAITLTIRSWVKSQFCANNRSGHVNFLRFIDLHILPA